MVYKQYLIAKIDAALDPERADELQATIDRLEKQLKGSPVVLEEDHEDYIIDQQKAIHEELFFMLEQRGVARPQDLTEYAFCARLDSIQKHGAITNRGDPYNE